jgi:hypothetical protein
VVDLASEAAGTLAEEVNDVAVEDESEEVGQAVQVAAFLGEEQKYIESDSGEVVAVEVVILVPFLVAVVRHWGCISAGWEYTCTLQVGLAFFVLLLAEESEDHLVEADSDVSCVFSSLVCLLAEVLRVDDVGGGTRRSAWADWPMESQSVETAALVNVASWHAEVEN